nr:hypothetical protein BaRGS_005419 [Batillaria attramentaria]
MWSGEGCWVLELNETHTTCTCNHLSTFAVLVTYTDTAQVSAADEKAMFILTAIGCTLSIASLALTLCTYVYLRSSLSPLMKRKTMSCWLSAEEGLIWAFLAPMLVVVSLNVVILGLVIRVFLTLRANSQKSEAARVRAGLRAMGLMIFVLHCVCNEEVRRFLAKKRSGPKSRTPTSESNVSVVWHRRYPGVTFDDIRLGVQAKRQDSRQAMQANLLSAVL